MVTYEQATVNVKTVPVESWLQWLPRGAGIDTPWNVYANVHWWEFSSAYHVMNDMGYYTGWVRFTVKFYYEPTRAPISPDMFFAHWCIEFNEDDKELAVKHDVENVLESRLALLFDDVMIGFGTRT